MGGELISTQELARILHEPDLRIFDCTTRLDYQPPGSDIPYIAVPGLDTFEAAHIPGADFLDIQGEFSRQDTRLRFVMAGTAELELAFDLPGDRVAARHAKRHLYTPRTRHLVESDEWQWANFGKRRSGTMIRTYLKDEKKK